MAADSKQTTASEELKYASGDLRRETGWWGAFVIGLAGTILVTGIAPVMVTALGASSIPITIFITLTGWLLCLFLAELAAMMPERTGGSPAYAYPAYKDRWPRFAKHINGFTAWAYWLGWFPVAPLNMILASFYLADRFHLNTTAGFTPIHTFIAWSTLIISIVGILLFFIPAYRGIRFGATFATVLGAAVDDPADLHRGCLDLQPERGELGRARRIPACRRIELLLRLSADLAGGRSISPTPSC